MEKRVSRQRERVGRNRIPVSLRCGMVRLGIALRCVACSLPLSVLVKGDSSPPLRRLAKRTYGTVTLSREDK